MISSVLRMELFRFFDYLAIEAVLFFVPSIWWYLCFPQSLCQRDGSRYYRSESSLRLLGEIVMQEYFCIHLCESSIPFRDGSSLN